MIRWAVTGPTGAGKSRLTGMLAARGAAVVDGDALGHEILAREETVSRIRAEFGAEFVRDGRVDRSRLGALVFADRTCLERLNRLTHAPLAALAAERLREVEREGQHPLAVLEAAVYFLLPSPPPMDLVIAVTARPDVRAERLRTKLGLSEADAASRVRAQEFMEEHWERADVVFHNDGDEDALARFASELWAGLPPRDQKDGP